MDDRGERIRAQRDREMERVQKWNVVPPRTFCCAVSGVSFVPDYPNNLWALQRAVWKDEKVPAMFVREPDNPVDHNAVRIEVAGKLVGHLTRPLAARVAPVLDAGRTYTVNVTRVTGKVDHLDQPGCQICANLNS